MKTKLFALAVAAALTAPMAQAMEDEFNMLTGAVYNALRAHGIDTTNVDQLTLHEVGIIKNLLDSGDMDGPTRKRIEKLLDAG